MGIADLGLQRLRRSFGDDPAAVDDPDVVGELVGLLQVLGGEEDGGAVFVQPLHLLPDRLAADRVKAGRRLVEEEHARFVDQRGGEVEAALHPARVGAYAAVGGVGEVDPLQQVVGAPASLVGRDALERRLQADQLAAGHQRVERRFLQGDADRAAHRPRLGDDVVAGDGGACHRSAAAASSASARSSSCRRRWARGSRRSRPRPPRGRSPAPRAPRRRRALASRRRSRPLGLRGSAGRAAAAPRPNAARWPARAPRPRRAAARRVPRRPGAAGRSAAPRAEPDRNADRRDPG